jgi:hypothetical protein
MGRMSALQEASSLFDVLRASDARRARRESRGYVMRGAVDMTSPCENEVLTHPLERLMDDPRIVRALGFAVPLIAHVAWTLAGAACIERETF